MIQFGKSLFTVIFHDISLISFAMSPLRFCLTTYVIIFLRAVPTTYGGFQARGGNSYSCWPTPQPQQCQIWTASVTYAAYGNTRSLTNLVWPGMETMSWPIHTWPLWIAPCMCSLGCWQAQAFWRCLWACTASLPESAPRERPQTWDLVPPLGKQKEVVKNWSGVLQDQEKVYVLKLHHKREH